ncbi:MAG: methyltransferase domain-containing protein [Myxococcales bacterium]
MDNNQVIQNRFGESADLYAKSGVHSDPDDLRRMTAAAQLVGNERVLDLGTGTAHTALAFAPLVADVVGLDLTQEMLDAGGRLARERGIDNLDLKLGDAEAIPFENESFDLVVARQCPHHFADVALAVREAARVLRPGGRLLILDSISLPNAKLDTFMNAVEILRDPSHVRNYSLAQWKSFFEDAGIVVRVQHDWLLRLEFEDWTKRGGTAAPAVAQLRAMLSSDAPSEVLEAYAIDRVSHDFGLPVGLTEGQKPA